jgi:hypothetical protein
VAYTLLSLNALALGKTALWRQRPARPGCGTYRTMIWLEILLLVALLLIVLGPARQVSRSRDQAQGAVEPPRLFWLRRTKPTRGPCGHRLVTGRRVLRSLPIPKC